jgi:hypothetical protein
VSFGKVIAQTNDQCPHFGAACAKSPRHNLPELDHFEPRIFAPIDIENYSRSMTPKNALFSFTNSLILSPENHLDAIALTVS